MAYPCVDCGRPCTHEGELCDGCLADLRELAAGQVAANITTFECDARHTQDEPKGVVSTP